NVRYLNFSPAARGDSIASIIAGQLHEADDRTRAALITFGLILFLITALTNVLGRYFIGLAGRSRGRRRSVEAPAEPPPPPAPKFLDRQQHRAEVRNRLMTGVLAGCQVLTVVPLFLILGYILFRGAPQVDADLFARWPAPPGQPGGGLGHAVLGSLVVVGLAGAVAV